MRQWFPFTDYDFFAHMFSGALLIAGVDFCFNSSMILKKGVWTPLEAIVGIAMVYIIGLVIAQISSFLLERGLSETVLHPTILLQLGGRQPRQRERIILMPFASRECRVPPNAATHSARLSALSDTAAHADASSIFQECLTRALAEDSIRSRMLTFQNQYGLSRNLSLSFFILSFCFIFYNSNFAIPMAITLFCLGVSMLGRYLKFYSAYSREAFRKLF